MISIDENLLQHLIEQARQSPRKRMNFNLHEHLDDKVQRLLNALEPGTVLPIHRHPHTAETYLLLRGELNVLVYNDNKQLTETVLLSQQQQNYGLHIPAGTWHTVEVLQSAVILEIKEGPYCPLSEEDILA